MCDLNGTMDEFEKVKAERDRLRKGLELILINTEDAWIARVARKALAGKEGG